LNKNRLLAIIKKEVLQIKRDRPSLAIAFALPLLMLILFGYAVTTDVEHISLVVMDQDQTRESRNLVNAFRESGYFDPDFYVYCYRGMESLIDGGKASAGLVIPRGYAKSLSRGEQAQVQFFVDGSDPLVARTALNTAQILAQVQSVRLKNETALKTGLVGIIEAGIDFHPGVWYNPEMKSVKFNIPGLIGLIMQNITMMLTAFALVRERERGTMEQLIVTPVKPVELIIGKLIPYIFIALFDVTLILLFGVLWFKVPVSGSVLLLMAISFIFLLGALGIGLLISTLAKTQLQAMQVTMALILPSVLLSGFMFPRDAMPVVIQWIGYVFPITYFLEVLRGIMLKGVGLENLWQQTLILTFFGAGILTLAAMRFKKKLD
jgi:ABC-2 type transport system permease protein